MGEGVAHIAYNPPHLASPPIGGEEQERSARHDENAPLPCYRRPAGDGCGHGRRSLRLHADPAADGRGAAPHQEPGGPDRLGELHRLLRGRAAGGAALSRLSPPVAAGRAGAERRLPRGDGRHGEPLGLPAAARDRRTGLRLHPDLRLGAGARSPGRRRTQRPVGRAFCRRRQRHRRIRSPRRLPQRLAHHVGGKRRDGAGGERGRAGARPRRTNACASGNQGRADHLPQGFSQPLPSPTACSVSATSSPRRSSSPWCAARRRSPPSSPTSS